MNAFKTKEEMINNLVEYYKKDGNNIYTIIARALDTSLMTSDEMVRDQREAFINCVVEKVFPHGSGFDAGTQFNWKKSTPNKLVFDTSFHHMNDCGYYDGWTVHQVIITPSLSHGYDMCITGKNKRDIKDYIGDMFGSFHSWEREVAEIYLESLTESHFKSI